MQNKAYVLQYLDTHRPDWRGGIEGPGPRPPKRHELAAYDDSFSEFRERRKGNSGTRKQSTIQRKKAVFLERKLQDKCIAYAEKLGCVIRRWDNDNNPDTIIWLGKLILGFSEFKSPTGRATEGQEERIKELRTQYRDKDVARIFRRLEDFVSWLEYRIKKAQ